MQCQYLAKKKREKRKTKEEKRGTGKLMVDENGNQGSMLAGKKETESVPGYIYP